MTLLPGRERGQLRPREWAGSQAGSGTEQAGVLVPCPCPTQEPREGGSHLGRPRLNCQEGAGQVLRHEQEYSAEAGQGQEPDSLNPMDRGQLGLWLGPEKAASTGQQAHVLRLTCPVSDGRPGDASASRELPWASSQENLAGASHTGMVLWRR